MLSFYDLANPGIISVPLGFIGCWLGTVLTREEIAERTFDELYVRSETGLGAEVGTGLTLTGRRAGAREAVPAGTTTLPHP
jgi:cation/acetate symporter